MGYLKTLALASCLAALPATSAAAVVFTGQAGGGQSFTNMQPSLALGQYVQTAGREVYYPQRDGDTSGAPGYYGQIRTFGYSSNYFSNAAQGGLQAINRDTPLFSLLGTSYGGDGRTTFALPNLGSTTMVGAGVSANGSTAGNYQVGTSFGQNVTTMTMAQMPVHDHGLAGVQDTRNAGGGQPIDNRQASLAITYGIVANGGYQQGGDGRGFIGEIQAFAGNFTPNGLLSANGQLVSIAEYTALYYLIGTTYGGDGVNNFRLPDLIGRTAVGASTFADATHLQVGLGQITGSTTTTLTEANLPAHVHTITGGVTEVAGGSQAFSTTQPSLGIKYIINTGGLFPQREVGPYGGEYMLGEVTAYAGLASQLPRGWLIADGSILSIDQNAALFALLGTTYGGNGSTTFALPDLRGRIVVGAGSRDGVTMVPGQVAGQSSVALSIGNLPVHNHPLPDVPAVPEPTTWAMMLVGFGMIGATTRYRRRSAKVTYA